MAKKQELNLKKPKIRHKRLVLKRVFYYERKARKKGYNLVAGVDEAGRGPLAGPVVSAAVIIEKNTRFKNRVDDSKRLTPLQREKAFEEITSKAIFGVGIINEQIIDELNILKATSLAMENAILDLSVRPDYVLIDGRVPLKIKLPIRFIVNGDSKSFSIASASIIAKVIRDRIMDMYNKIYPQYKFQKHKGYGTRGHILAIRRFGPSPIHRMSFRPLSTSKA